MQKFLISLTIVFITLTILGAIYVFTNPREVNAGYAAIPMVCALASLAMLKSLTKKN